MPFDLSGEIDATKLSNLATLYANGGRPRVQEVVTVFWQGGANPVHYANTAINQLSNFTGLASLGVTSVQARFTRLQFLDIPRTSDLGDDSITLDFYDGDGAITTLWKASGEGTRVVVREYIEDVQLLVEVFSGLLKAPDEMGGDRFKIKAATGFRSPNLPLPRRIIWVGCSALFGGTLRPDGSYLFPTQADIDDNDCPYNRHIGGAVGTPGHTSCPRNNPAACNTRLGDTLSYLGFDIYLENEVVGSGGNRFVASSRGNESLQKRALRVVYGTRVVKDLDLLGFQPQSGGDHPERGYLKSFWLICEGEIGSIYDFYVNGQYVPFNHLWGNVGKRRQPPVLFTTNTLNYSGTAVMRADVGPKDWRGITGSQLSAQCMVVGKSDVRIYTTPTSSTRGYTSNRAWCLLDLFTNKRYGQGFDPVRFDLQGWIDLAAWSDETAYSVDESNSPVSITRTTFNADLSERTAQQQINDICLAGRYTLPFQFNGKLRVLPLKNEVTSGVPSFTDEGTSGRNIVFENGRTTLRLSQKPDSEVVNQLKVTFDDATRRYAETTFPYDDYDQQLRAGIAAGDRSVRVVSKSYGLLGVTTFAEAVRVARMLLDLGEFDQGGIKNNLRVKFTTWSPLVDALKLHPFKLIEVLSSKVQTHLEEPGIPFRYFRIMKMTRKPNLKMEIEAQAYAANYMLNAELPPVIYGSGGDPNPGGRILQPPRKVIVRDPVRTLDFVEITIDEGA
jgi:hypothetical protein